MDAALLLCRAKLQSHPDSTVAVLTMGTRFDCSRFHLLALLLNIERFNRSCDMCVFRKEVLVTLTNEEGKLLSCLHGLQAKGNIDLHRALSTAWVGHVFLNMQ